MERRYVFYFIFVLLDANDLRETVWLSFPLKRPCGHVSIEDLVISTMGK